MKAISLWQPWASLWLTDRKVHETRHWPTNVRGWLMVHAAKRRPDPTYGDVLDVICADQFGERWDERLPRGALIGMVHLVDCVPSYSMPEGHESSDDYHCGDFGIERFAWRRDRFETFTPIAYRGSQGFFEVNAQYFGIEEPRP